ncbi:MAG: hypothetical protein Q9223_001520 [Gallowayella weberi]
MRMFTRSIICLLWFCASDVFAAPPLRPPWWQPLVISQPNASTTRLLTTFPHPIQDIFDYEVPNSDLVIKFKNNVPVLYGKDTEIARVYRDATADVFHHSERQGVMDGFDHQWLHGKVQLDVRPEKGDPKQAEALTWRYWLIAITGFRSFSKEYPGRLFDFELFLRWADAEGVIQKFYLGSGALGPPVFARVGGSIQRKGSLT